MRRFIPYILLASVLWLEASSQEGGRKISAVFIGNSITESSSLKIPPPSATVKALETKGYTVAFANCGVSGSTTVDWLPVSGSLFMRAVKAANPVNDGNALLVFSISLGTNDSAIKGPNGAPVSPEQYRANLKTITDSLLARYPGSIAVIHRPIWYSPNTHNNSVYLRQGIDRLYSYGPQIEELVKSSTSLYKGDWKGFDTFMKNYQEYYLPENGNAGTFYLHPNADGAMALGNLWADAIDKAVKQSKK